MIGKEMPMAWTTEKAARRSDEPVAMLICDIRQGYGLAGSSGGFMFYFGFLCFASLLCNNRKTQWRYNSNPI